jgi:hypothetical protein
MSIRTLAVVLAISSLLLARESIADFTGARTTPRQVQVVATGNNVLSISWQITTTPDHRAGASSATADIVDPRTGALLLRVDRPLNATGAGPFTIRELLTLDADTVRTWADRGVSRTVLQRTFFDAAGNTVNASVTLSLQRSKLMASRNAAQGSLSVQAIRLEFDTGNNTGIFEVGESLRASLTASYGGTGILRGRWQVAEPGSSEGTPLYRTLSLVNVNLATGQRSTLRSPALPTARSGRYLLRFCVTTQADATFADDPLCPDPTLAAAAAYFVQGAGADALKSIELTVPNRQAMGPSSLFSWRPLVGVGVYRLQIFATGPKDRQLPSSRQPPAESEPEFVAGMVLKPGTTSVSLPQSARSKLEADQEYLWRVTAHDTSGRMLGKSTEATFVWNPAE